MKPEDYIADPRTFVSTASDLVIPSTPSDNITYIPSAGPFAYALRPLPPKKQRRKRKKSP